MGKEIVSQYIPLFDFITRIKSRADQKTVLKIFAKDKQFRKCFKEVASNIQRKNITVSKTQKTQLSKYKDIIKGLDQTGNGRNKSIKLIEQSGGMLPILLPILASIVAEVISSNV